MSIVQFGLLSEDITVYCKRCGRPYYGRDDEREWCQCEDAKDDERLSFVPNGIVYPHQEKVEKFIVISTPTDRGDGVWGRLPSGTAIRIYDEEEVTI
jgi:hypothetical protein